MSRRNTGGRARAIFFLLISLGAAAVAVVVVFLVISSYQQQIVAAEKKDDTVLVMVAARDLFQGVTIEEGDLAEVPNSVLRQREQAVGRVPRERILKDEFIREERLAESEAGLGLNAIIPRGMRALSINISDGSAVSGFLNPGNYVDVLVTLEGDDDQSEAETVTLLQAVPVLAVNARVGERDMSSEEAKPSVTVAVTPEQAERLTHAVAQGAVTLTLRNDIDVTHVETHGAIVNEMLGGDADETRITVKEWRAQQAENKSGTLIIISGQSAKTEKR